MEIGDAVVWGLGFNFLNHTVEGGEGGKGGSAGNERLVVWMDALDGCGICFLYLKGG